MDEPKRRAQNGLRVLMVAATVSLGAYVLFSQPTREAIDLAVLLAERVMELVG